MTVMAEALRAAGYRTNGERLREIAMQALRDHPTNPYARRGAIMAAVGTHGELLLTLFERHITDATDRLVAAVRNDMIANRRTGRYHCEDWRARAAPHVSGGRRDGETLSGTVPADDADVGDRPRVESLDAHVPGVGAQAVAAVVRLSLLDTFRVNGQPLGDVTPAEARLWAEARGRQARRDVRFVELITAGLPDGVPIRRFRREDEAAAAWSQALTETV